MSLPDEKRRAIKMAREFLLTLLDPRATPRVPRDRRLEARHVLRHFPFDYEIDKIILPEERRGKSI